MKKLFIILCVGSLAFAVKAADSKISPASEVNHVKMQVVKETPWPVWLDFNSSNSQTLDVVGLHLNFPYGAYHSLTGLDFGFYGVVRYMYGLQINILRSDVLDFGGGFQFSIYNSFGRMDTLSLQVGLWNEAASFMGLQVGLINVVGSGNGLMVGLINRADDFYGYQVGLVNVIYNAPTPFFPFINVGF